MELTAAVLPPSFSLIELIRSNEKCIIVAGLLSFVAIDAILENFAVLFVDVGAFRFVERGRWNDDNITCCTCPDCNDGGGSIARPTIAVVISAAVVSQRDDAEDIVETEEESDGGCSTTEGSTAEDCEEDDDEQEAPTNFKEEEFPVEHALPSQPLYLTPPTPLFVIFDDVRRLDATLTFPHSGGGGNSGCVAAAAAGVVCFASRCCGGSSGCIVLVCVCC